MGFDDLLIEQMEGGRYDAFHSFAQTQIRRNLQFGKALLYALCASYAYSKSTFSNAAMHIGGVGVLGHMVDVGGISVADQWRGTHDLDMVLQERAAYSVLSTYATDTRMSPSLGDKMTATLCDGGISSLVRDTAKEEALEANKHEGCSADIYVAREQYGTITIAGRAFDGAEFRKAYQTEILGVTVRVADLFTLLRMKLDIRTEGNDLPREKDMIDVYSLVGVAEKRRVVPADIFTQLSGEQRSRLMAVFNYFTTSSSGHSGEIRANIRFAAVAPTDKYLRNLRELHKETRISGGRGGIRK